MREILAGSRLRSGKERLSWAYEAGLGLKGGGEVG